MGDGTLEPCAELELFWIRLARNTCASVTLSESFCQLEEELAGTRIGAAVADVRRRIDAGESLHVAMARHPGVFAAHVLALVEGGSRAGIYDRVFILILEQAWRCPGCMLVLPPIPPREPPR